MMEREETRCIVCLCNNMHGSTTLLFAWLFPLNATTIHKELNSKNVRLMYSTNNVAVEKLVCEAMLYCATKMELSV